MITLYVVQFFTFNFKFRRSGRLGQPQGLLCRWVLQRAGWRGSDLEMTRRVTLLCDLIDPCLRRFEHEQTDGTRFRPSAPQVGGGRLRVSRQQAHRIIDHSLLRLLYLLHYLCAFAPKT